MLISHVTWPSPLRWSRCHLFNYIIPYILFALEEVGGSEPCRRVVESFLSYVQVFLSVFQDGFVAEFVGVKTEC